MYILAATWDWQQVLLAAIGVLIVGVVMLRMSRQRLNASRGRSSCRADADRPAGRSAYVSSDLRDQLDHLMVQLEELARTTTAQIETRYSKLEILLQDADARISRLDALLQTAGKSGAGAAGAAAETVKPEHRQVYELADAGNSPLRIAQQIGRDVGEVELILALRKNIQA